MRFVIFGMGAIGSSIAVKLFNTGVDVVGIARGRQLEVLQSQPLALRTPKGTETASINCVDHASKVDFGPNDVVLLCVKGQDTEQALQNLRAAGVRSQPIVCMQNGVANEGRAARYFDNVIGCMVQMPATFVTAGEVICSGAPKSGIFDIGLFPNGVNQNVTDICDALNAANFAAFPHENVMTTKYGKLLLNLNNGVDSVLGPSAQGGAFVQEAQEEARAVFAKAGISYEETHSTPERQKLLRPEQVEGAPNVGSSAAQSLVRNTGAIEIDFLNGEIAYLGRIWGVPTPVNAFFTHLSQQFAREGKKPGDLSEAQVDALFQAWQE